MLTHKIESLEMGNSNLDKSPEVVCDICECDDYLTKECPTILDLNGFYMSKPMLYMNSYKRPLSHQLRNSYNPNWRNHPNFGWNNEPTANTNVSQGPPLGIPNAAPQGTSYAAPQKKSLEDVLSNFIRQ